MKKRLLALLLALTLVLSLAACGQGTSQTAEQEKPEGQDTVSDESQAPEAPEEAEEPQEEVSPALRETQFGPVQGVDNGTDLVWYGIPYAAAPVGELRWSAPQDPEVWSEPVDCTQPGEKAIQFSMNYATGESTVSGSEDCLNLDVYAAPDAENLPVLVYIHGGNNQSGSTAEIPGHQIVVNNNCVYVSVNYRLGLLGFNCLPALQTEEGSTGNYTMLDLAKALDWVKANIAQFGGDPNNITVSGFSAGGRDVMAMLVSPLFAGKFDKAIAFSGGMTIADEEASASQIASAVAPLAVEDGKAADEAAAKDWLLTDGEDVKEYLYSLDAQRLAPLMGNAGIRMSVFPHLYNDGVVLPEEGFDTDSYNAVPLLMLTGATEFSLFCGFDGYYFSEAFTALDEETQSAAKNFALTYGSDMYRIFNAQCSAEKMYDRYDADIYICQVEYGAADSATQIPGMGSFHGIFVPMMTQDHTYGNFADFSSAGYNAMSGIFNNYLKSFLATGDPNCDGQAQWDAWTPDAPLSMVLDAGETEATAEMKDVTDTYDAIMDRMDADDSVPEEIKMGVISNVMNGRWFSDALDARYENPSLWR